MTGRTRPRIRIYRPRYRMNAPGAEVIVERRLPSGRTVELGPRGLLTLDEATEVLDRPRDQVLRAIRASFLRARRRGRTLYVTVQACADFLREEQADIEEQERTVARIRAGRERAIPWELARRRL